MQNIHLQKKLFRFGLAIMYWQAMAQVRLWLYLVEMSVIMLLQISLKELTECPKLKI